MSTAPLVIVRRRFGETARRDAWWIQPLVVFLGLSTFLVYATWAAFQGEHYTYGPYLSPFYSPEIFGSSPHSWFGPKPAAWPAWLPFSPALLILPIPAFFRLTCYYYRGAYYKAFWARSAVVHRRRAAVELLGREFVSAHPAERPSLHAVPLGRRAADSGLRRVEGDVVHRSRRPERCRSASASARSCWRPTPCCSADICSAAIRCGTSSGAASISCRARRSAYARTPA